MTKEILSAQREVVQGYYIRISNQNPDIETILQWLESDLEHLSMGDAVESAKDIIMEYDPHEYGMVECLICTYRWIAVRPEGTKELECPKCMRMTEVENV